MLSAGEGSALQCGAAKSRDCKWSEVCRRDERCFALTGACVREVDLPDDTE